jgi:hypothetical protein
MAMPSPHEGRAAASPDHRQFDNNRRRRRSQRLKLPVRVLVYGWATRDSPFKEIVYTLLVNVHGGLIALAATPQPGEVFLLVNTFTDEEQQCRVVHVGPEHDGRREVGFELMRPEGWFWWFEFDSQEGLWSFTDLSERTMISRAAPSLKWKFTQRWRRRLHGIERKIRNLASTSR